MIWLCCLRLNYLFLFPSVPVSLLFVKHLCRIQTLRLTFYWIASSSTRWGVGEELLRRLCCDMTVSPSPHLHYLFILKWLTLYSCVEASGTMQYIVSADSVLMKRSSTVDPTCQHKDVMLSKRLPLGTYLITTEFLIHEIVLLLCNKLQEEIILMYLRLV